MTPEQHDAQRDLVLRASLLADTPEERHGVYARRKPLPPVVPPVVVNVGAHVFCIPVVVENPWPL